MQNGASIDVLMFTRFIQVYLVFILFGRGFDFDSRLNDIWPAFVLALLTYDKPLSQHPTFCTLLALAASFVYLLDWSAWFQRWPLPTVFAAAVGKILDLLYTPHT
jgi:hypothetical protein